MHLSKKLKHPKVVMAFLINGRRFGIDPLNWLVVLMCLLKARGEDLTVKPRQTGTKVVEATVDIITANCIFSEDKLLLRRMAYTHSMDGKDLSTFREDYHGGIWQVGQRIAVT